MNRFYYQNSIAGFLADSEDAVLGALARSNTFDLVDLQRNAWLYEIRMLKDMLRAESSGQIIFEYSIPRLGRRIDVVLLLHGIVFVLEFKVGEDGYLRQDLEQVWDYALDLKNFHEASRNLTIVPILVATDADSVSVKKEVSHYDDRVFEPISANAEALPDLSLETMTPQQWELLADRCYIGLDWCRLLQIRPDFADRCPWEKLNGNQWCFLLREQPQFGVHFPPKKLGADFLDLRALLEKQPQFAGKFDWGQLPCRDIARLLAEDWETILDNHPFFKY